MRLSMKAAEFSKVGLESTLTPSNCAELQRDWAREATVPALAEILFEHGGATGTNLAWELQLLAGRSGVGV
jgi:hypothetical protein